MHWGKSIALVYVLFAGMILFLVIRSMQQKIDLVSDNYYEKELQFDNQIHAEENTASIAPSIECSVAGSNVVLQFPSTVSADSMQGTVYFYRPSDSKDDITETLHPDVSGRQVFSRNRFVPGLYVVKISWQSQGRNYYFENDIIL